MGCRARCRPLAAEDDTRGTGAWDAVKTREYLAERSVRYIKPPAELRPRPIILY